MARARGSNSRVVLRTCTRRHSTRLCGICCPRIGKSGHWKRNWIILRSPLCLYPQLHRHIRSHGGKRVLSPVTPMGVRSAMYVALNDVFLLVHTDLLYCCLERSVESGICMYVLGRISIVGSSAFFSYMLSPLRYWSGPCMQRLDSSLRLYVALRAKRLLVVVNNEKLEWSRYVDTKAWSPFLPVILIYTVCD